MLVSHCGIVEQHEMTNTKPISHRERIYVRAATIATKLQRKAVSQAVLRQALLDANDGNPNSITVAKMSGAVDTKKDCYPKESRSQFFIPYNFKVYVADELIPETLMESLNEFLEATEDKRIPRQMSVTLENSQCSMWYLDKDSDIVTSVSNVICNKFQ